MNLDSQPFWIDDLDPNQEFVKLSDRLVRHLSVYIKIAMVIFTPIMIYGVYLAIGGHTLALSVTIFMIVFVIVGYIRGVRFRRNQKEIQIKIFATQNQALTTTNASLIGSAVHVAGHPGLRRDQPVVLALIQGKGLCFYSYENDQPLETLSLEDILATYTVVYDDERIPHIDVVDSTAQALQIVFQQGGNQYTTLIRSMKKVRPIDWYHALNQARSAQPAS